MKAQSFRPPHRPCLSIALQIEQSWDFTHRIYAAMQVLRRLMNGQTLDPPTQLIEPRGVVERQSTLVVASGDPDVLAAARFIREHAHQRISVEDVMDCVTCSRRTLEHRFKRDVGHSIHQFIWEAHVALAKQLLIETDLDTFDIVVRTGFASRSTFSHVFRSQTGMTPTQFRRKHRAMPR